MFLVFFSGNHISHSSRFWFQAAGFAAQEKA
jgi:hypothetical protein